MPEAEEEVWNKFFELMKAQMERNGHRKFREKWFNEPLDLQLTTLQMSIAELRTALVYGIDVEDKAADVANWACIIMDHVINGRGLLSGD